MRIHRLVATLSIAIAGANAAAVADESEDPGIPLEEIGADDRPLVAAILESPTVRAPLEEKSVAASIEIYEFLLARLDFTARIVNRFRLGDYDIRAMGPDTFHVDDLEGAVADVRLVHAGRRPDGETRRVYLARGYFQILGDLRVYGDGLIVLDYNLDAERRLRTRATVSFKVKNEILDRLGRLARKALEVVVEKKAGLFVRAAQEASELVARDAARVARRLDGYRGVDADDLAAFREAFVRE